MTPETIALLRQTWADIVPLRKQVCARFYAHLFESHPDLRPLFKGDIDRQGALLVTMINTVFSALENPRPVSSLIKALGARHAGYGVTDAAYDDFAEALLWTLERTLGERFTPQARAAWSEVYDWLARTMRAGATEVVD